jgi:hypothetical protein
MTETAAQKKARLAKEKAAKDKLGFQVDLSGLAGFGNTGTSISTVDLSTAEFNVAGLGLPLPKGIDPTKVNGTQLYNALVKSSIDNPSTWLPIKYALAQSNFYSGTPSFTPGWNESEDGSAVKSFLSTLVHKNSDLAPTEAKTPVATFLAQTQNLAKLYGGAAARTQVQKVTVPNALDLQKIADTAFRSALGAPPTLKQKNDFVKSYTQQVMAVARASAASTAAPTATPSMAAVQGAMTPAATPEAAMASITKSASGASKQPSVVLKQVQQAPDASLAAQKMAIASAPADAASQSVDNALNAMFTSLQRNANG